MHAFLARVHDRAYKKCLHISSVSAAWLHSQLYASKYNSFEQRIDLPCLSTAMLI